MGEEIEQQIHLNYKLLRKRLHKIGLLAVFVVLLTLLLVVLVNRKANEVESVNQIISELQQSTTKREQTSQLLTEYEDKSAQLRKVFPNERTIADFVKELEKIASLSSSQLEFTFETEKPRRDKNQHAYLTYSLRLTADLNGLLVFLDRFERVPYMTAIRLIQAQELKDFAGGGRYLIKADVYVEEPFSV